MFALINISTWLTFLRIFLVPWIMVAIYQQAWVISFVLFSCAGITDFFDGYYARLYNQETNFGRLLDPVADKILLFSTLFALYQVAGQALIPFWFVLLFIGKDLILILGAVFLLRQNTYKVIAPSILSKWVTALCMFFLMYLMLLYSGLISYFFVQPFLWFFTIATVFILFDYIYKFFKMFYHEDCV